MDVQTWTYLIVGFTFALYIGIAIWSKAKSTKEFYVAGGNISPLSNGMATAADWMSAASFLSMAGIIAFSGYGGSVFLMGWTGGYVLLAFLVAPYLRKYGKFTVPEFIGERFYSKTARLVAVLCLIIVSVTYVIGQMKGVGVAFSRFLETDYSTGLFIGMAIVFFYAVLGGMKGITYTQIAQYVVLIFAFTVPAIFISLELTGNPIPQLGLIGDYKDGTPLLQKLDTVITELGFDQYTQSGMGSKLNMFAFTLSLMIGTAGLPHVIIRFFTVKKVSDARLSAGWALVFIAILYTTAPAVAAMARLNFVKTVQVDKVGVDSGNIEYAKRPEWFKNWEKTGLLKHEDKNGDGRIQYYNDKDSDLSEQFSTYGWKGNEMVTVDKDIIVLANPEIADLPDWVIALVVAGGLAAALSTAAGLLLAISSSISHDLLKGIIMPNITDRQELNAGRLSMIGAIALAGYLGLNPPDFAAGTVAMAFGLAASSIFPVLIMGIFMKKINREGAIAGMVAGLLVTLLYVFQHKGIMFIPGTSFLGDSDENWFFGIEPKAIGAFGALVNFVVAYVVSKMTKETPKEVQELVDDIRLPNVEEV
ncbi:MAG: sodium:solute symporter family protein [Verrucomicrobiota bacterium]|jgi:cation/acetate symporter|nr:cation acetate symporter [Verrucomicrobiaceae bacterium]MED5259249.1 sodium:solute symporter family protein [Verrucomicrobiota bacterium]MEE2724560.1 sodium:solute symporter family protein [Verrucomicrobiota bacterium]|tara:strand:- start:1634 stop:3400 length:1767 start_codon:yes stop_codon:yes gene_type:complete